jgi:hypothetical protein
MAKGPLGQKRPAGAIGCAVMVAEIATREAQDTIKKLSGLTKSGQAWAVTRSLSLSSAERSVISYKAASARWRK